MRVIAGTAKRLVLKTVEGMDTRPTTDRIKETLFNMLQYDLVGSRFLDLYSGSGGIGIESLSRGASYCVFIEHNKDAAACIRENLKTTKLENQALVIESDVLTGLNRLEKKEAPFDFVFMDPPYHKVKESPPHLRSAESYEKQVLDYLSKSNLIHEDTLIIVEASKDTAFDYLKEFGYTIIKRKEYKTNMHLFMKLGG